MTTIVDSGRTPLAAFVSSRALLIVAAYAALTLFPVHTIEPWMTQAFPDNNWIDGWVRWDAFWYESIVDSANTFLPQGHSNANFFPFYGWVSWLFSLPFQPFLEYPRAFYIGAILLSHVAFLAGLAGVFHVTADLVNRAAAERTVWLMAFFPFSFFFAAVYADALYFCLAVWAFRFVQTGRWPIAAVLAVMASLTRITGFVFIAGLLAELIRRAPFGVRAIRAQAAAVAILALAPVLVLGYFYLRYGDPIAFLHARQTAWQRATGVESLLTDFDYYTKGSLLACGNLRDCLRDWDFTRQVLGIWYLVLVPVGVALALAARRTLGPGLVIWVVGTYGMALVNGLDGMGRFTAVLFPVFIALAMFVVRSRAAVAAVCFASLPFLLLFLGQFVRWRAVL